MITRRTLIILAFITSVWTHQSPAPIVEEEKPTPASEQSEAPKRKHHSAKSASTEQSPTQTETRTKTASAPVAQGPARFAGTWNGKINQGLLGHVSTSVTVDPTATSVELNKNLGGGNRSVTRNGNTISWHSGVMGEITWTLTPNADGQTAQVTMKGMLLNDTTTFRRAQASLPAPSPAHR